MVNKINFKINFIKEVFKISEEVNILKNRNSK